MKIYKKNQSTELNFFLKTKQDEHKLDFNKDISFYNKHYVQPQLLLLSIQRLATELSANRTELYSYLAKAWYPSAAHCIFCNLAFVSRVFCHRIRFKHANPKSGTAMDCFVSFKDLFSSIITDLRSFECVMAYFDLTKKILFWRYFSFYKN